MSSKVQRVSYLRRDGKKPNPAFDIDLTSFAGLKREEDHLNSVLAGKTGAAKQALMRTYRDRIVAFLAAKAALEGELDVRGSR